MAAICCILFYPLQTVAQISQTGMEAYFVINTLENKNKSSNFTSRRLVTKLQLLTLLIRP